MCVYKTYLGIYKALSLQAICVFALFRSPFVNHSLNVFIISPHFYSTFCAIFWLFKVLLRASNEFG